MARGTFVDRYCSDQSVSTADPVEAAAFYADHLVAVEKTTTGMGTLDAAYAIATRHRIPQALVRALVQPSRRPKIIDVRWYGRLWQAYLDSLRRQLAATELEIARVEALGASDGTIDALLDKATAQVRRIEALRKG